MCATGDNRETMVCDTQDLISVIIPCYNIRAQIGRCLDSVLAQDYGKLEILVIDDGSTDGSGEICEEYAARDPRVRVIHQENAGLGPARNRELRRQPEGSCHLLTEMTGSGRGCIPGWRVR